MTMVAIDTRPDRVTVMRDGTAYTPDGSQIEVAPIEVVHLPSSTGLTTWRGDDTLGRLWGDNCALDLDSRCNDFDMFLLAAPTTLREIVEFVHRAVADSGGTPPDAAHTLHVYLAGWSASAGRFISRILRSEHDFEPEPIEDMHATPAPTGATWTEVERRRWAEFAPDFAAAGVDQPTIPAGDTEPGPSDHAAWIDLARRIHDTRGCAHPTTGLKVPIGGTVTLTTLTRDNIEQRDLFTFSKADHARMLHDTLATATPAPRSATKVGRNDPCPCGSGGKYKRCCALVAA